MSTASLLRLLPVACAGDIERAIRCPPTESWAAYTAGNVGPLERERLESHLADCAACLGEVGFLVRGDRQEPPLGVPLRLLDAARGRVAAGQRRRLWRATLLPVAGAATLALALLTLLPSDPGAHRATDPELEPTAVRGSAPSSEARAEAFAGSPVLLRPIDGETVGRGGFDLEWRPTSGALSYTVQLMNARGDVVWEGRTSESRATVPNDAELRSGQRLFAWVLAETRAGASLRSPVVSLRVAPD